MHNISHFCGIYLFLLFLLAVALVFFVDHRECLYSPLPGCLSSTCNCCLVSGVGYTCMLRSVPHSLLEQAAQQSLTVAASRAYEA